MNADRLLQHYDRIADAPDAIARLRRFILDLAVRGKLVPQDPHDEPASELLKRLKQERRSREKKKAIKALKLQYGPIALEANFQMPPGWEKTTIGETCDLQTGATPNRSQPQFFGGEIRWLVSGDINQGEIFDCDGRITNAGLDSSNCKILPKNCILIALNGQGKTRGMVALLRTEAACNQSLVAIIPLVARDLKPEYLHLALKARYVAIRELTGKDERRGLNMRLIECFKINLPPPAEQHRIVAKVDELMDLCDRLEEAREARETVRDRLAAASLARLNAPDPETFVADARFAIDALPALTTRSDQIKRLRQTILNLAVRGKLEPQDPNDEPASELLKRIATQKARLVEVGKLKRMKEMEPLSGMDDFFELPKGWDAVRLGNAYDVRDGTHDTPKYVDVGIPLITSKNLSSGYLSFADVKLISEQDHQQISDRSQVDKDDILFAMIGSIGNPVIVDTEKHFSIKNVALFKYYDRDSASPDFLRYFLQASTNKIKDLATGGLQPFVSLGFLRAYPIALPPLAEQRRIVAKVDSLMVLCDQLEASLNATADTGRRLLDALLAEALAPVDACEIEAAE
jgi:type I restriction enzyme S subunit